MVSPSPRAPRGRRRRSRTRQSPRNRQADPTARRRALLQQEAPSTIEDDGRHAGTDAEGALVVTLESDHRHRTTPAGVRRSRRGEQSLNCSRARAAWPHPAFLLDVGDGFMPTSAVPTPGVERTTAARAGHPCQAGNATPSSAAGAAKLAPAFIDADAIVYTPVCSRREHRTRPASAGWLASVKPRAWRGVRATARRGSDGCRRRRPARPPRVRQRQVAALRAAPVAVPRGRAVPADPPRAPPLPARRSRAQAREELGTLDLVELRLGLWT